MFFTDQLRYAAKVFDLRNCSPKFLQIQKEVQAYFCYNFSIMSKSLIAFLSVLLIFQAQETNLGGYSSYEDLNSQYFTTLMTTLRQKLPEIDGFTVTTVQRQIMVNGYNFIINLEADNKSSLQLNVYSSINLDQIRIYQISPLIAPRKIFEPVFKINDEPNASLPISIGASIGGYFDVNLSLSEKKPILNEIYRRYNETPNYQLVRIEKQIVSGANYRLTFKKIDGSIVQYTLYVPLGGIRYSDVVFPPVTPEKPGKQIPINGGWSILTDPQQYKDALNAIKKANNLFANYNVSVVQYQVVAGANYIITLVDGQYNSAKFQVYIDPVGASKVFLSQYFHAYGFTPSRVQKYIDESIKKQPSISKSTIFSASNIWPLNKEGLKLKFQKPTGGSTNVFIYSNNGVDSFSIFDN